MTSARTAETTTRTSKASWRRCAPRSPRPTWPSPGTSRSISTGATCATGPNPAAEVDPATYHWFSGDGMVHGVALRDGKACWYRNRWVRSLVGLRRPGRTGAGPARPAGRHPVPGRQHQRAQPRRADPGPRRGRRRQLRTHRGAGHRRHLRLRRDPVRRLHRPSAPRPADRRTARRVVLVRTRAERAVLGDRHPWTGPPNGRHRGVGVADDARLLADRQICRDLRPAGDVRRGAGVAGEHAALAGPAGPAGGAVADRPRPRAGPPQRDVQPQPQALRPDALRVEPRLPGAHRGHAARGH